jgi:hypothetical protein
MIQSETHRLSVTPLAVAQIPVEQIEISTMLWRHEMAFIRAQH